MYNSGFNTNITNRPNRSNYIPFEGIVTKISNFNNDACSLLFEVQNATKGIVNFVITPDTYFVNQTKITVGMPITAFYDGNAPAILIYPPQYQAIVVSPNNQRTNIKVSRFDRNLISEDGTLKLNIGRNTDIVMENGQSYRGTLQNKNLIVLYGASTRSIPAQTTPDKIIVLCNQ